MRKAIISALLLSAMLLFGLTGCSTAPTDSENANTEIPLLTEAEIEEMYTNTEQFIDRPLELTGQVFNEPEYDSEGVYFQMYADPANWGKNTVVGYANPDFEIAADDYVKVTGRVYDVFEGENAFGSSLTAPMIIADTVEILSYQEVVAPALHTIVPTAATQDQMGYTVTIDKIELAEQETRVYVTVTNNGSANFSLYSYDTKILQNTSQYEESYNYEAGYPEVQSNLSVGVVSEGIICFPPIEYADFQLIIDGSSDDWSEDIEPYQFDITVAQDSETN